MCRFPSSCELATLVQVTATIAVFTSLIQQQVVESTKLAEEQHSTSTRTAKHQINETNQTNGRQNTNLHQQPRGRSGRILDLDHVVAAIGKDDKLHAKELRQTNSGQQTHRQSGAARAPSGEDVAPSTTTTMRGAELSVSSGAKLVLSIVMAIILLVVSATLFDFVSECGARKRTKGYDDIHSQDNSDANTESMLIHETDSMGDDGYSTSGRRAPISSNIRQLVKQIFVSFSICHSCSLIFQNNNSGDKTSSSVSLSAEAIRRRHHEIEPELKGNNQHLREHPAPAVSIDSLHGLRFLSMIWIIIIHTYSFAFQWSFFKYTSENIYKTAASQLIANGAFACDSFFLIGGFLLPYLTFPAHNSTSNSNSSRSRNISNNIQQAAAAAKAKMLHTNKQQQHQHQHQHHHQQNESPPANEFKFTFTRLLSNLLHRYLRMMPLMMAIIGLSATLLRYLGEGPAWDYSTQMYDKWCRKNWWINALFLHNFLNRENMCLSHSWYAAVDLQLFLLGQVILFVLAKSRRLGLLMCSVFLFGGQLLTALITLLHHLPALPLHASVSPQSMSLYYGEIYIKPYCRASPYLIGILLAYLMRTTPLGQVKLRRWQTITGWSLSIGSLLVILLSTLPAMNGQAPGDLESALYNALSRPLWACGTGWMVFACITNHGGLVQRILSARQFIPFSRLSYSAFLIHPIVMAISYGGRQTSVPFSHYLMLCLVLGNIVITYASAFVLSALFELPLLSVERAVKRTWRSRSEYSSSSSNNNKSMEAATATAVAAAS